MHNAGQTGVAQLDVVLLRAENTRHALASFTLVITGLIRISSRTSSSSLRRSSIQSRCAEHTRNIEIDIIVIIGPRVVPATEYLNHKLGQRYGRYQFSTRSVIVIVVVRVCRDRIWIILRCGLWTIRGPTATVIIIWAVAADAAARRRVGTAAATHCTTRGVLQLHTQQCEHLNTLAAHLRVGLDPVSLVRQHIPQHLLKQFQVNDIRDSIQPTQLEDAVQQQNLSADHFNTLQFPFFEKIIEKGRFTEDLVSGEGNHLAVENVAGIAHRANGVVGVSISIIRRRSRRR